jgi:myo-inositol-1(or 4)-monophosphatase
MTLIDHDALLADATNIVIEAGRKLLNYMGSAQQFKPSIKSSIGDLVTPMDVEIQNFLAHELIQILPGSQVVGEESDQVGGIGLTWVIDPIDGSTNIAHGIRHAAICVALCRNFKPVIGIVHNPFTSSIYQAVDGRGAFAFQWPDAAKRVKLSVSENSSMSESLLSFGMPYDRTGTHRIMAAAEQVFGACQDLRRRGSASLDIVAIARGQTEGHFELDLRIWDVAAAGLVLTEAGGILTDWRGESVGWQAVGDKVDIAASNGLIQNELLAAVRAWSHGRE